MIRDRRTRRTTRIIVFTCAAIIGVSGAAAASGFRLVLTTSMPRGLYRSGPVDGAPMRLDTVAVCLPADAARLALERAYLAPSPACPGGVQTVTKVILAVASDTVVVTPAGLVIRGQRLPNTAQLPRDRMGRALPQVPAGVHVIPRGYVWVGSTFDPRSFDSRYFGPVPDSTIVREMHVVWTEMPPVERPAHFERN